MGAGGTKTITCHAIGLTARLPAEMRRPNTPGAPLRGLDDGIGVGKKTVTELERGNPSWRREEILTAATGLSEKLMGDA